MSLFLVTGANGWLGSQLVRTLVDLNSKSHIRCLVQPGTDTKVLRSILKDLEIIEGDLRNCTSLEAFFKGASQAGLFHCAGLIHPKHSIKEFYDVNVQGTENLLMAAENLKVRRAVIVSSNSPIGISRDRHILFDENSPYNPYMNYGRSKMLMEKSVHSYQKRGNLETVIVRAPWFYGPGQPPRQTLFFSMIKNGKAPIVGDGNNLRSMAYLENLCQGLILCEKVKEANGQTYWISDESPYTTNEIVNTIEKLLEKEFNIPVAHKRLRLPDFVSEIAMGMDWFLQSIGLYHQKIHVLSEMNKNIACSIEKAKKELGYNPKIALEEGMLRSIKWCLENGHVI